LLMVTGGVRGKVNGLLGGVGRFSLQSRSGSLPVGGGPWFSVRLKWVEQT